jgi:hypothetical protein
MILSKQKLRSTDSYGTFNPITRKIGDWISSVDSMIFIPSKVDEFQKSIEKLKMVAK